MSSTPARLLKTMERAAKASGGSSSGGMDLKPLLQRRVSVKSVHSSSWPSRQKTVHQRCDKAGGAGVLEGMKSGARVVALRVWQNDDGIVFQGDRGTVISFVTGHFDIVWVVWDRGSVIRILTSALRTSRPLELLAECAE